MKTIFFSALVAIGITFHFVEQNKLVVPKTANEKTLTITEYIEAMIEVESSGNPRAVSRKGAKGLMQLMPIIQKAYAVEDPFDPKENIRGGIGFFAHLLTRYRCPDLALAAYNAGETRVNKALVRAKQKTFNGISKELPKETQGYVHKINSKLNLHGVQKWVEKKE